MKGRLNAGLSILLAGALIRHVIPVPLRLPASLDTNR